MEEDLEEFLELATNDGEFQFFVDDLDHLFQLKLIKAQYSTQEVR